MAIYILILLIPCILVSIFIGFYVGYGYAIRHHSAVIEEEREKTLIALQNVVRTADELSSDVVQHNTDLQSVGSQMETIDVDSDNYEQIKSTLLRQITDVIESNKRVEHDLVCTRYQLEEQAQELDRTRVEARTDALSGLGNRKSFDEALQYMHSLMNRSRTGFALLLMDVDHFKWINDTHGHKAGDGVVQLIGESLKKAMRPGDHVARFGGDEFALIIKTVSLEQAIEEADRVTQTIDRTNFDVGPDGSRIAITFSLGLAIAEVDDSTDSIFHKADVALYRSKEMGRNRLTVYDEIWGADMLANVDIARRREAESELTSETVHVR